MSVNGKRVCGNYILDRGKWRRMRWSELVTATMERMAAQMPRPMSWRDCGFVSVAK